MRDPATPQDLLDWYDRHARTLPWRIPPHSEAKPDPYRVWLSEIMLQQTTVAAVKDYFHKFTGLWPTVQSLAAAEDADVMAAWAGLGYYARARNLLKCARAVTNDHNGQFPQSRPALQQLPGIGPYTSAAIAAIAFDAPETVVDGNVERVMARLHDDPTPLPKAKPVFTAYAAALTPQSRPGDYAQAVMDLGATICTPRNPACGICPWRTPCQSRANGTSAQLPRKTPKAAKPTRHGIAYVAQTPDGWLLERRPAKGLLGGMLGWPGTPWTETDPAPAPPCPADWHPLTAEVRHTFTHFHLILKIETAALPAAPDSEHWHLIPPETFRPSDLPSVMQKVFTLVCDSTPDLAETVASP